jgi:hypothetical protein
LEDGLEEECDDDLVELNSLEVVFICIGSDKKKGPKSVGRPQQSGIFFIPCLVRVKVTTSNGQNASYVVLHTWLRMHMELGI